MNWKREIKVSDRVTIHTVLCKKVGHGTVVSIGEKYGVNVDGYAEPIIYFDKRVLSLNETEL